MNVYGWFSVGIGLFTFLFAVPTYIVFLYMIVKYRRPQFNIPFYGLVFQCGLLDLWYVVHEYLLFDGFLVNLVPQMFLWASVEMATISFYGYFYIHVCQAVAVLMISINRFTALVMPLRHDLIWTQQLTWMTIIIQHVVGAMLIAPALVGGCLRDYVLTTNGTEYKSVTSSSSPYCAALLGAPSALFLATLSVVLILLYVIIFFEVRKSYTAVGQGNQNQEDQRKTQRNLAIGGAIISMILVLNTVIMLISIFVIMRYSHYPPLLGAFKRLLDTLFCIVNPFVLLCFGSKIRPCFWKCVRQIFCIKENQSNADNQNLNQRSPISPNNQLHHHNNNHNDNINHNNNQLHHHHHNNNNNHNNNQPHHHHNNNNHNNNQLHNNNNSNAVIEQSL